MSSPPVLELDFCCYRACLGTVLRSYGCAAPELVLGSGALSSASPVGAELRFSDDFEQLSILCERRGYSCERRPGFGGDAWQATVGRLAAGRPVISLLDPFYLPHFWANYQRSHKLHAVVLWSLEQDGRAVHLSDPCELSCYDAVVPLETVERSWLEEDHGQSYIDLRPSDAAVVPARRLLVEELRGHLRHLVIDGNHLACLSLATIVRERLDAYLELVARMHEPANRRGTDERRRRCSHFLGGIRSFHNTLRWFARFADLVLREANVGRRAVWVAELNEIAQAWLVIRNLLMKYGLSEGGRRAPIADCCSERLDLLIKSITTLSPRLAEAVDEVTAGFHT